MAADFEISQMSGTGSATITVKPKTTNDSENLKEQVLQVVVQGVEREVTLVQKGRVESWRRTFKVVPTGNIVFPGDEINTTQVVVVYSYEQKYYDDKPQQEFRTIPFSWTIDADWLEVESTVEGEGEEEGVPASIVTLKSTKLNQKYDPDTYLSMLNFTYPKISQEGNTKVITLTVYQDYGKNTSTFDFEPLPVVGQILTEEASAQVTVQAYRHYKINGIEVGKKVSKFKIPTIAERKTLNLTGPNFETVVYECWITDYPSEVTSTYLDSMTCTLHCKGGLSIQHVVNWSSIISGSTFSVNFSVVNKRVS